jgi:hypothetical protein
MKELLKSDSSDLNALAQADGGSWVIATGEISSDSSGARSCTVLFRLGGERYEQIRVPVQGSSDTAYTGLVTQIWDRLRRLLNNIQTPTPPR